MTGSLTQREAFRFTLGLIGLVCLLGASPVWAGGYLTKEDGQKAIGQSTTVAEFMYQEISGESFSPAMRGQAADATVELINDHLDNNGKYKTKYSEKIIDHMVKQSTHYSSTGSSYYSERKDHIRECPVCNALGREILGFMFPALEFDYPFTPVRHTVYEFDRRGRVLYRGEYRRVKYSKKRHRWEFRYERSWRSLYAETDVFVLSSYGY